MHKISHATVQRILDATDIVEVVSDFVSLKRRGANWVGLCPFHNDRSPSFYVSKAKGVCKCFACGEGGSAVNFLMKLEQLSYTEALKWLAKKYNIQVEERELTPEEERQQTARESMFALNDFAMRFFEKTLRETDEGRDVGMSYFRYRGISDQMIERFHLGFSPESREALSKEALSRGYSEDYLLSTGLCYRRDDGQMVDRFRGRVIYPVFTISGKPVAFGGRTLKKEKTIAKYVNSPESDIYSKRRELYGLFQAKGAIAKAGKCYIVEGYMDVISMHQAGVCNVVASSGTALTIEQVRMINRFTRNVTLIYDADAAGIKAALRGIELLLQEGFDIKVLLLPEGEDPDSFAQSHSSTEVEAYISEHETDFITFMARILLEEKVDDPTHRANVITRVVKTIALIPNEITRSVYIQECSRILFISEDVLQREVGKYYNQYAQRSREERERGETPVSRGEAENPATAEQQEDAPAEAPVAPDAAKARFMRRFELNVVRLIARYGLYDFAQALDEEGNTTPLNVLDYVTSDLASDGLELLNADCRRLVAEASRIREESFAEDRAAEGERLETERRRLMEEGIEEIRREATDMASIHAREQALTERVEGQIASAMMEFDAGYLSRLLCSSPDDTVRNLATELVVDRHQLSKMHTKYAHVPTEMEQLCELTDRSLYELKEAELRHNMLEARERLKRAVEAGDEESQRAIMVEIVEYEQQRKAVAKLIGSRVITPLKR